MVLADTIRTFLDRHRVLTLATVDDGGPWATPLFYASDDALALYFLSDPGTRHCRAIAQNPRVSAAIHGDPGAWTEIMGVQLDGWAAVVEGSEEWAHATRCYAAKFPFALALIPPDGPYRFYRLRPRWLRLIDNSRGLGFKEELLLMAGTGNPGEAHGSQIPLEKEKALAC